MVAAFKRLTPWLFFLALPLLTLTIGAVDIHRAHNLANDFRFELYPEAKLVAKNEPFRRQAPTSRADRTLSSQSHCTPGAR
jgi:hypothetical protein